MKYIMVTWSEIQDYMMYGTTNVVDSASKIYFDPIKNVWFVPEDWDPSNSNLGGDIGDLEDALG